MHALNQHSRILNVSIERISQLRCLQNILEVNDIDTSILEDTFSLDKNLSINIIIEPYVDEEDILFNKKAYSKVEIKPEYNILEDDSFTDIKYIKNLVDTARIFKGK